MYQYRLEQSITRKIKHYNNTNDRFLSHIKKFLKILPISDIIKLANRGFFYTGLSNTIFCYKCGQGLFGWLTIDEVFYMHSIYYPECPTQTNSNISVKLIDQKLLNLAIFKHPMLKTLKHSKIISKNSLLYLAKKILYKTGRISNISLDETLNDYLLQNKKYFGN
uniref:Uncharacterized protein n=1 Tax=Faxonius propinquus nudivirus TaxID=3139431 RepID=A0AAU8GF63_9VIRU